MTNLGKEHPIFVKMNKDALSNNKVHILNKDGYKYIEDTNEYFDVIIIDLPDPKSVELSRLYSYEFYIKCYKHLRQNGVIITQAGSPYFAPQAFKCIQETIKEAGFSTIAMHNQVVTLGEWGWVLGAKNISTEDLRKHMQNLSFNDIETKWINKEAMMLITSFGKDFFKQGNLIEVNKIHHPVLCKYYLNGTWEMY